MQSRARRGSMTALAAAGLLLGGSGVSGAMPAAPFAAGAGLANVALAQEAATPGAAIDRAAFQDQMRRLWEDHIIWTRLYIVSAAADLPDLDLVAQRLLQNQTDIGNAVKPFYGEEAGEQLAALLKEHILDAADLVTAAKAGDTAAAEAASAKWYANADAIAAFLNAANPEHWPLADLQAQMKMHLDVTLQEATDRLKGDYAADIADFDRVQDHILMLADLLSGGIVQQFPERFA